MNRSKYQIDLTREEQTYLENFIHRGKHLASVNTRARLLLKAHQELSDTAIRAMLGVGFATIWRVKRVYLSEGLERALREKRKRKSVPFKADGRVEMHIIQLACSPPPEGRARWTVRLLGTRLVELGLLVSIKKSTVRKTLKKMNWRLI